MSTEPAMTRREILDEAEDTLRSREEKMWEGTKLLAAYVNAASEYHVATQPVNYNRPGHDRETVAEKRATMLKAKAAFVLFMRDVITQATPVSDELEEAVMQRKGEHRDEQQYNQWLNS